MEGLRFRYYIIGRLGTLEVFPNNLAGLSIDYSKDDKSGQIRPLISGKIQFSGIGFNYLYTLEKTTYRCEPLQLRIDEYCKGGFIVGKYAGQLFLNNGNWNLNKSLVDIECKSLDNYTCYDDNKDNDVNLFSYVDSSQTVNTIKGTIETVTCSDYANHPVEWCQAGDPYALGYEQLSYHSTQDPSDMSGPGKIHLTIIWIREVIQVLSSQALAAPWIFISDDGTHKTYARPPVLYDKTNTATAANEFGFIWQYGASFDNGFLLKDIISYFLNSACPALTLKSDFFQWNADNVSNINYATGQQSKVKRLVLFQKSDVKRPDVDSDATDATTNFDSILTDVCTVFKLQWWIDDNNHFRIEHESYINRAIGIDLTLPGRLDEKLRVATKAYSYNTDSLPSKEIFTWMDSSSIGDFAGKDIVYKSGCVSSGTGITTVNHDVKYITTDVQLCLDNPDADSNAVSDDGFVLVACDDDNAILFQTPILSGNKINNTLSWAALQYDYFRYNTYFKDFVLNNVLETSLHIIPNKKQVLNLTICCDDVFNPNDFIKTELGSGMVDTARLDLYKNLLNVTLLYDAEAGLYQNQPPATETDNVNLFENTDITIDVLANDSDPDGIVINTLAISAIPSHGTAIITPDYKIKYTPAADYVGSDVLSYTVKDVYGEISLITFVYITVNSVAPPIVANADSYSSGKNKVLSIASPGLIGNDTSNSNITVNAATKATDMGGSVTLHADGSFEYTPPVDFVGTDVFTYTIHDLDGNVATGNVTLTVVPVPMIYVKLVKGAEVPSDIKNVCSGGQQVTGTQINAVYNVYFYADSAGTIPLDTSDFEILLHYHGVTTVNGVAYPGGSATKTMEGTSIFLGNYVVSHNDHGCDGHTDYSYSYLPVLETSSDYQILS